MKTQSLFANKVPATLSDIPKLGVGIGFRPDFRAELFLNSQSVDFLEITADHYLNQNKTKQEELDLLKHNFTLIPHAINLSLGSADGLDERYLTELARLVEKVNPPYWSEHLCFTKVHGLEIGHLSPVPYTREAVDIFCRNIEKAQKLIPYPLILENITYPFVFPGNEMSETQFIREVLENSNTGLLLDITNLYINSVNHHFDYKDFLAEIPLERIVQLHITGGYWFEGILVDGHSHPTPPEIWELMEYVLQKAPVKGIILERDENIPPFSELQAELNQAREVWLSGN